MPELRIGRVNHEGDGTGFFVPAGVAVMTTPTWTPIATPAYPQACGQYNPRTQRCMKILRDRMGHECVEPPCVGRVGLIGCFEPLEAK